MGSDKEMGCLTDKIQQVEVVILSGRMLYIVQQKQKDVDLYSKDQVKMI